MICPHRNRKNRCKICLAEKAGQPRKRKLSAVAARVSAKFTRGLLKRPLISRVKSSPLVKTALSVKRTQVVGNHMVKEDREAKKVKTEHTVVKREPVIKIKQEPA